MNSDIAIKVPEMGEKDDTSSIWALKHDLGPTCSSRNCHLTKRKRAGN